MKYVLIPLLPFAAFVVIGLFGHWIKERAHWIAVPAVAASFLLALSTFDDIVHGNPIHVTLYSWITSGAFDVSFGLYIDRLTAAMLLLVTVVSGLVHVYTIGYMHGEPGYARFFAYVALFTFSMLMLVMADNFLQLYVFWEAVGLCSYLLIGHWYERKSACDAATKAFIVNRVGDFGFGLGVMLIFAVFGSLQYDQVFAQAVLLKGQTINLLRPLGGEWPVEVMTVICLLLFAGAVGKSAQVPLHVWLPDAMEGPTPISALIHAATMVTAGVFMVARLAPLYNLSPAALDVVAVTGGVTAIFAATIALTQNDIKRVVAWSTVSQLGYMMMACGFGAYVAGIYHLLTHGAFKALLFLCCGSVIIALHHEQDMRRMGGLKDKLPVTYWTMLIGSLALAGFPLTAGFFSKDEILVSAWLASKLGKMLALVGLVTAFMTAFYSFRLLFVAFWGESRVTAGHADHIHEPSPTMTIPLIILAVLSILTGYLG
ncbi:MAG: NADH-quinone oxidoreductase subunit L, partial [Nitrospirae bacterium 13_2_20CM_2_63_8]